MHAYMSPLCKGTLLYKVLGTKQYGALNGGQENASFNSTVIEENVDKAQCKKL